MSPTVFYPFQTIKNTYTIYKDPPKLFLSFSPCSSPTTLISSLSAFCKIRHDASSQWHFSISLLLPRHLYFFQCWSRRRDNKYPQYQDEGPNSFLGRAWECLPSWHGRKRYGKKELMRERLFVFKLSGAKGQYTAIVKGILLTLRMASELSFHSSSPTYWNIHFHFFLTEHQKKYQRDIHMDMFWSVIVGHGERTWFPTLSGTERGSSLTRRQQVCCGSMTG